MSDRIFRKIKNVSEDCFVFVLNELMENDQIQIGELAGSALVFCNRILKFIEDKSGAFVSTSVAEQLIKGITNEIISRKERIKEPEGSQRIAPEGAKKE